ncbi:hypothetical protein P8452_74723 [Trifolium repens]|nr:hypothetical protein P8452_74723 [Trifolium repens]
MQGIVSSGISIIIVAWCIKMRGPLFASVFYPLQLLLIAVSAYLMLDEKLYLGSILGAMLIVCGLYVVLWSKNKEMKENTQLLVDIRENCGDPQGWGWRKNSPRSGECGRRIF